MIFRHKKTGQIYRRLASGTDCTNARDGTPVVVYRREADPAGPVFVREEGEFYERFEDVGPGSVNAKHAAGLRREIAAEVADRAEAVGARQGVSPEAIAALRAAILEGM